MNAEAVLRGVQVAVRGSFEAVLAGVPHGKGRHGDHGLPLRIDQQYLKAKGGSLQGAREAHRGEGEAGGAEAANIAVAIG